MKTPEELNAIKTEVEALNAKLAELSEEEIKQVSGGTEEVMKYAFRMSLYPSENEEKIIKFLAEHGWNEDEVRRKIKKLPYYFWRFMDYYEYMNIRNGLTALGAVCSRVYD